MLCLLIHAERWTVLQLHCQPCCQQRLWMLPQQRTVGHMPATTGYVPTILNCEFVSAQCTLCPNKKWLPKFNKVITEQKILKRLHLAAKQKNI